MFRLRAAFPSSAAMPFKSLSDSLGLDRSAIRVEADDAPDGTIMTVDIDHSDIRVVTEVVIRNGGRVISATELVPADATR